LTATFDPAASTLPGFGLWLFTLPVAVLTPSVFFTVPILQAAAFSFVFATASLRPTSFGTVQRGEGGPSFAVPAGDDAEGAGVVAEPPPLGCSGSGSL
jgi:hypothetical protein